MSEMKKNIAVIGLERVNVFEIEKKSEVNIFDFGGGMGVSYIDCLSYLPKFNKIKFHVLDLKRTCELGRKIFNNNDNIIFHDDIPMDLKNVNIVHLGSSLQYVEDYTRKENN